MTPRRSRDLIALAALSLAALVLGHDLVFLMGYGSGVSFGLRTTGHGMAWLVTVATAGLVAGTLTLLAVRRLISLSGTARALRRADPVLHGSMADLRRRVLALWGPILVISLALFVVNENIERALIGLPLPGTSVLVGVAHVPTVAVFALVALGIAAFAGLYRWRRDLLVARVRAARARWTDAKPTAQRPRRWADRHSPSIVGRRLAGRAPPPSPRPAHS